MWGGQVRIISTHNGEDHPFNQLIEEVRKGRKPYGLHRITLDDALGAGLYRRICLVQEKDWTPEAEEAWREDMFANYGDDAEEELMCVPAKSGGAYFLRTVVEACQRPHIPILRWKPPAPNFVHWSDEDREAETEAWCRETLLPILSLLPDRASYLGVDFARVGDLSVYWPLIEGDSPSLRTPFILELRDCPHTTQEQIFKFIAGSLPRFSGAALDAGGNGSHLAERAEQEYGPEMIARINFHASFNLENWPRLKGIVEDRDIDLPAGEDITNDFRAVRLNKGVPGVPASRGKDSKDGGKRHGDSAVACMLAAHAAYVFEEVDNDTAPVSAGGGYARSIAQGYSR